MGVDLISDDVEAIARSLDRDVTPYLAGLRRYARALAGSRVEGDKLVKAALRRMRTNPNDTPKGRGQKISLYAVFHDTARLLERKGYAIASDAEGISFRSRSTGHLISDVSIPARQALLLKEMEGFSNADVSYLLGIPETDIIGTELRIVVEIDNNHSIDALIMIGDDNEARIVSDVIRGMGFNVFASTRTWFASFRASARREANLIIAGDKLADGRSGISAAEQAVRTRRVPVVLITERAEFVDQSKFPEGAFVVRPNFDPTTLKEAILRAVSAKLPVDHFQLPSGEEGSVDLSITGLSNAFAVSPGPIIAEVVQGRLELAPPSRPQTRVAMGSLDELRKDHLADVERVLAVCSNVGPAFQGRFETLSILLRNELSDSSTLRIANQVTALDQMKDSIDELLSPQSSADVKSTISSLITFTRQFPVWREFLEEAIATSRMSPKGLDALEKVAASIIAQNDSVISPDLRKAVGETFSLERVTHHPAVELSLVRAISNPFKAIGRYLIDRANGAGREFNKALEEELGSAMVAGLRNLVLAASTPLLVMASQLPAEFAWVGPLLALFRVAQGR